MIRTPGVHPIPWDLRADRGNIVVDVVIGSGSENLRWQWTTTPAYARELAHAFLEIANAADAQMPGAPRRRPWWKRWLR